MSQNAATPPDVADVLEEFDVSPDEMMLSELHFKVLALWGCTDLSHAGIADALDTSEETVHKYITRRKSKREQAEKREVKAANTVEFLDDIES